MVRSLSFTVLVVALTSGAFARGQIDTVARGAYACELPGDAGGAAGIPQPDRNFTIETGSRYTSPQGAGTYLRRGKRLDMTSGPRKGDAYLVVHPDFVRLLKPDGAPSSLRCVLRR